VRVEGASDPSDPDSALLENGAARRRTVSSGAWMSLTGAA
jgi:hypothetical protein